MSGISISINARQRCIIFALLKSETRVTLDMLSKQTGLTSRIIRYNMETVKAWFHNEGVKFQTRPGFGVEIDANRQTRKRLLQLISDSDGNNLILTRNQRQRISLFELLTSYGALTYHDLASNQGISRSTIVHDVKELLCSLNSYHLILRRHPNKGAFLEGSELSRRFALLNVIREELGDQKWYSLWYSPDLSSIYDKSLPINLEKFLSRLPLKFCKIAVTNIENLIGKRMALYSKVEMLVYLALCIDAMNQNHFHEESIEFVQTEHVEMEVAQAILKDICRKFEIQSKQTEIEVLAASLMGAKWEDTRVNLLQGDHKKGFEGRQKLSYHYADDIVSVCSKKIHPLLRVDHELIAELARHLDPVLYRLRYHLPILNDSLDIILEEYPEVFHAASLSVTKIETEMGINFPPEEIAFIAMYVVAAMNRLKKKDRNKYQVIILGDGIRAKTSLLKSRLEYEFPVLEVIGVLNGYMPDEMIIDQAGLVLSMIPGEIPGKDTIQVSSFLNSSEKKLIQSWINEQEDISRKLLTMPRGKPNLVDLLVPRHIVFNNGEQKWREAVTKASQPLLDNGNISFSYVNSMIQVIEEHGPYMLLAPHVILLHARPSDGVNALCLSMLILEQPIQFGDASNVMVDIAFVLGAIDEHAHVNALLQLSSLASQPDFCQAVRQTSKASDVLRIVWGHSLQYLEE